jgi:hypothetical protein
MACHEFEAEFAPRHAPIPLYFPHSARIHHTFAREFIARSAAVSWQFRHQRPIILDMMTLFRPLQHAL